ncbi:MAG: alpha/beta hydrolase [Aigarchaeota archaeon]|nr:alpha/beta hydrolase [Aigarchaeota archaeon]MDW8092821.1 alpha/beta hydrolase [Nitrososphaerota archaeon]
MYGWDEHVNSGSKVRVNGLEVFYVDKGAGEPVVLLHGWASSSFSWRNNFKDLSKTFRTVAPDLPGFGNSERLKTGLHLAPLTDHLLEFLSAVGVEGFSLVGHSMGGVVSSYLASTRPTLVRKLVLINPSLFGTEVGRPPLITRIARVRPIGNVMTKLMVSRPFVRSALRRVYVRKELIDESVVEGYFQSVKRSGTTLLEAANLIGEFSQNVLSGIRCPVLFILGQLDTWVPYERNKALAESMGARVIIIPDAGHNAHEENPNVVNRIITEFLAEL